MIFMILRHKVSIQKVLKALRKVWIKVHSIVPCFSHSFSAVCLWRAKRASYEIRGDLELSCFMYACVYVACSRETRISRVSSFPINPYVVATGAVSYNICMVSLFTVTARVTHVQLVQFHALLTRNTMRYYSPSWELKRLMGERENFFQKCFRIFSSFISHFKYFIFQLLSYECGTSTHRN